jgi:hypothetical protein
MDSGLNVPLSIFSILSLSEYPLCALSLFWSVCSTLPFMPINIININIPNVDNTGNRHLYTLNRYAIQTSDNTRPRGENRVITHPLYIHIVYPYPSIACIIRDVMMMTTGDVSASIPDISLQGQLLPTIPPIFEPIYALSLYSLIQYYNISILNYLYAWSK